MSLSPFLPEVISIATAIGLVLASFLTSALSAAMGLGGGLALIAVMANLVPVAALVPVHGLVQIGSNTGRSLVMTQYVKPNILLWYCVGAIGGAVVGGLIVISLPAPVLQLGIALFVLWSVWGRGPAFQNVALRAVAVAGFAATMLGMFFGASGPVSGAVLSALGLSRHQFVANQAITSLASHILKIIVFGTLGFAFGPWLWLVAAMIGAGFAGTLAGNHLLGRMNDTVFKVGFRILMSGLSIKLIYQAFRSGVPLFQ